MGVGEANKNVFHIFGIDILVDENGWAWLLEINASPSLNMYVTKQTEDTIDDDLEESKTSSTKVLSKLDKDVKVRLIQDAIKIAWNQYNENKSSFEMIFNADDDPAKIRETSWSPYDEFTIINKARIIFELIAGYWKPDYVNVS